MPLPRSDRRKKRPPSDEARRREAYETMLMTQDILQHNRAVAAQTTYSHNRRIAPAELVAICGARAAAKLCTAWGGNYLPKMTTLMRYLRQEAIRSDVRRGFDNPRLLAQKYGLSVSFIDTLLAEERRRRNTETAAAMARVLDQGDPLVCRLDTDSTE